MAIIGRALPDSNIDFIFVKDDEDVLVLVVIVRSRASK